MTQTPADEHRLVAGAFTERVDGVDPDGWDAPAPVEGWTARDVVGHLVEWLPALLGFSLGDIASVRSDPVAAWHDHADAVQRLLEDPASHRRTLSNPHIGELPIDEAINNFYTSDVFLHTWDLARATGQDDRLDPDRCAAILAGSAAVEEAMRASGQFGPAVSVPADAPVQDRLIGFIGRDPSWQRPAR
ncbi:TIGR03086 family metal-binding protein [Microlunatus soli]|uniref:TIGR03086 family protein n=1 Tax=Microlunatus soli TaxID=630515 RepID=A0A1H1PPW8_9ACTN|nr:TIGR03086 family metal-binding protein [Microlunatus soli]SDS13145.1 TIGR03086 family protein [Microlunatus soli]